MVEASKSLLEFPDHVEGLHHEWLGDGDHLERLGEQVTLLDVVLIALACLDEVPCISEGGCLVEAMPEGLSHNGPWCCVVPTDAAMDVKE